MDDIVYCPKPECLSPTVREDVNINNAICAQCRYEFCVKCEKNSHQGPSSTEFIFQDFLGSHIRIVEIIKVYNQLDELL